MPNEFTLSPEIVNTIIGAASGILSALIAFFVTRFTIAKEKEKMKMGWAREDAVASEDDFKAMSETVAAYTAYCSPTNRNAALVKVAGVRAAETREFAEELDALYSSIRQDNVKDAEELLSKVIEHKRKIQREANAPLRNKKKG